jgi:DNA-binding NarL/FixJ family response regulator
MSVWLDLIGRLGKPSRVLVVEAQALIAQDLAAMVHESGATVVGIAHDAVDALLLTAEHRPDLAIVDIHLRNGDDGILVAREIREMAGASIIFCTGSDDSPALRQRICDFGKARLLLKPVDFDSLSRALLRV